MKEIWKLIELLNERDVGEECWELYYLSNGIIRDDWWNILYDYRIISKQFWFIKWLVENDKIDTSKANDKNLNGYEIELRIRAVKELVADSEEKTVLYLKLLMLLSISSSPIEDLISYLK